MGIIRPCGITRIETLKDSIRSRNPRQHPGQNISLLVKDYLEDANELEKAGQYDHSLTRSMLKAFLNARGKLANGNILEPLFKTVSFNLKKHY